MNTRIEKLNHELSLIPSTNKKKLGIDGLKNEYFYFQDITNKIFVKHAKNVWNEFINVEEVEKLLESLTEKGNNEKSLISKINKILKRGKFDKMLVDDDSINIFTWTNKLIKPIKGESFDEFENLTNSFESLEDKITEYLYQDQKEWESFATRQQWVN
jgi:F0F1-type ATP synthase alpha subunit